MAKQRQSVRLPVAIAGLLLVASWLGCAWWRGDKGPYAPGAVSQAHAIFGNECGQCHTEPFRPARQLGAGAAKQAVVTNDTCLRCHADGVRSDQQIPEAVLDCAACHREHDREHSVAQVADRFCTGCHADLKRKDRQPSELRNVSGFAGDHPEFKAAEQRDSDPAAIAFNHAKHLQPGGVRGINGGQVYLPCGNCHVPDSERHTMLPIRYERHCAECHSNALSVLLVGDWQSAAVDEAAKEFSSRSVPHRETEMVRGVLRERLTELVQQNPPFLSSDGTRDSGRPLPSRARPQSVTENEWSWVNSQLSNAERVLFDGAGGCRYCHQVSEQGQPNGLPALAPTQIADRWMPRSRFSHGAHNTFTCTECHPAPASFNTSDVLMPSIDSCRRCHTSTRGLNGTASTHCVDCHPYHREHRNNSGQLSLSLQPLNVPAQK